MRRCLAAALLLACLTACTDDGGAGDGWTRGAESPLSPRWAATVGWTGTEMIVAGGVTTVPYPPGGDFAEPPYEERFATDGAAYDPEADEWRPIPDAPVELGYYYRSAMSGDTLVVFAPHAKGDGLEHRWYAYDASDDEWRVLPDPPGPARDPGYLSAWKHEVYALDRDSRVMVLDVSTDAWTLLPRSPERPAIDGISVVGTDLGPVVTGGVTGSADRRAEIWEGERWRRFPDPIVGGQWWHWTGERLVDPDPQVGAGGEPAGGLLDVETGEYSELRDPPTEEEFLSGARGGGADGPLITSFGYLYDDRDGSWTALPLLNETLSHASGVLADGRLVMFGGFDSEDGYIENEAGLSHDVWVAPLPSSG